MRKRVLILGSTGSIGRSTLSVIESQREDFEVFGLVCKENVRLLNEQIERFRPRYVAVLESSKKDLVDLERGRVLTGMEGIKELIAMEVDIVVNAISGSQGLEPTIEALKRERTLALANKESVVMAGRIISRLASQSRARLLPVDSEHSALFQLLERFRREEVKTLIITCSGGPLRDYDNRALSEAKPEQALIHPVWTMGKKITLDSATLMNKAFEVIEVRWLFDIEPERIRVLVHPESIIHGLLELIDGSVFCYMAHPDMRIPISFAINEGKRRHLPVKGLSLEDVACLTFFPPDEERFPAIRLAYEALRVGDSAQVVMNAANEVAGIAFMQGRIKFTDICRIVREVMEHHEVRPVVDSTELVLELTRWARSFTERLLEEEYE